LKRADYPANSGSGDQHNSLIKNHGQKFMICLLQKQEQRNPIALMCHCEEDQQQCHRHILKATLDGKVGKFSNALKS
jgi:hypothetical protein